MTPTLYYLPPSPPCRSVLLLGRMLGIEFQLKTVNVLEGEHLKQEYTDINPQHTIPTLVDHGLTLWESRVIMTYLVSVYGKDDKLYPKDARTRAIVDHRLHFDLGTMYQRMADYFFPVIFLKAHLDESKKSRLSEALRWFDTMLKGRPYAAGDAFTVADICLCVTVSQIEAFGFELTSYRNVRVWLKKCKVELDPFGYEDINQNGADTLAALYLTKVEP